MIACQGGGYMYHLPARPGSPVFREAQKYVRARLEKKWVPLFIAQPDFLARTSGGSRKERGFYTDSISPSNTVVRAGEHALVLQGLLTAPHSYVLWEQGTGANAITPLPSPPLPSPPLSSLHRLWRQR